MSSSAGKLPTINDSQRDEVRALSRRLSEFVSAHADALSPSLVATLSTSASKLNDLVQTREEEHALKLILLNVDNDNLSDAEFRQFIRNSWKPN
ncbi:MAG: hypothetical protein GY833_22640 [Aestuariibacter sp.]|nr:hypothetical protein [Aestuariibacter sp.]